MNDDLLLELQKKHGCKVKAILTPSQYWVIIREQNGDDDDILSNSTDVKNATALNNFLSGIIVHHELLNKQPSPSQVVSMKLKDKYYCLMASRIFSIGSDLKFEFDWEDGQPPVAYVDDLEQYLWDYSKPYPEPEDPNYFKYRVTPYTNGQETARELELSSGKRIKYEYLTGLGEKYLLELPKDKRTINANLKARALKVFIPESGDFVRVDNFKMFNPKDMVEIRKDVDMHDIQFDGLTEVENPRTGEIRILSLISLTDFFYPVEI
jgi:hypothetical protein